MRMKLVTGKTEGDFLLLEQPEREKKGRLVPSKIVEGEELQSNNCRKRIRKRMNGMKAAQLEQPQHTRSPRKKRRETNQTKKSGRKRKERTAT